MQQNTRLDQLLITLSRSLLQYVGEAWPWTDSHASVERQKINELVALQQKQISRLSELLSRRNGYIDFGTYPTEYTDLHYVALDYLLSQLIENEDSLITDLEQTLQKCTDDSDAIPLLQQILSDQRASLSQLQELAESRKNGRPG
jgi:predicted mannosyl-3-phosphoglycerate phosphatase (HAD superfamily)